MSNGTTPIPCCNGNGTQCATIQILEPTSDALVANQPGSTDPSLQERGDTPLTAGQTEVVVTFVNTKASNVYRFEYLYVDALGEVLPGTITAVPVSQTAYGFTVELAGAPIDNNYVLRWRVVVIQITAPGLGVDVPESVYVPLPLTNVFTYNFINPRSDIDYGFTELRVENVIDLPGAQIAILPVIVLKQQTSFTVLLSAVPPNGNYYLVARTP